MRKALTELYLKYGHTPLHREDIAKRLILWGKPLSDPSVDTSIEQSMHLGWLEIITPSQGGWYRITQKFVDDCK